MCVCAHVECAHAHCFSEIQPWENVILGDVDFKLDLECFN